jgi:NitT/TauT family transport system substrate-binding protein
MKTLSRTLLTSLVAVLTGCLSAACAQSGTGDAATLTVGFVVDPSWAQVPVADQGGLFRRHGVTVKVIDFPSGIEALQAVAAGQVDVTTAADVPVAAVLTRSPSLKVVADGSRWNGSRIIAARGSGVRTIADLAGKSIGTPLGTSADYFVASALAQNRVSAHLVQVSPSATVTAATRHNVDALSIFQPYQEQVVQALGADAVELNGGSYIQHSLYLASATAVRTKAAALTGFFGALSDAGAQLSGGSGPAVAAVATATQLDPALLRRILPEFDYTLQLQPGLASTLADLGRWGKTQGAIAPTAPLPDYAGFLDNRFLPKAG